MKSNRAWGIGLSFALIAVLVISSLPVSAQGPVGDALATLAAATLQVQQTRQAQDAQFAAQRGTATAIAIQQMQADRESARQAQQTRDAIAATQSAIQFEATRSAQATRQALDSTATRQALDIQATAGQQHQIATATQAAVQAEVTRNASAITATAASIRVEQTRASASATAVMDAINAEATRKASESEQRARQTMETLRTAGVILLTTIGFSAALLLLALSLTSSYRLWQRCQPKPCPVVIEEPGSSANAVNDVPPPPPPIPATEVVIMTPDLADEFTRLFSRKFELTDHVATSEPPERIIA